jgi:hypothetical protein
LAVAEAGNSVVFIEALLRGSRAFDMPGEDFHAQGLGHLECQQGFSRSRLTLDQQGTLEMDGRIHSRLQFAGRDIGFCASEIHGGKYRAICPRV